MVKKNAEKRCIFLNPFFQQSQTLIEKSGWVVVLFVKLGSSVVSAPPPSITHTGTQIHRYTIHYTHTVSLHLPPHLLARRSPRARRVANLGDAFGSGRNRAAVAVAAEAPAGAQCEALVGPVAVV